jgi:hypothetical protein
MRVLVVCVLIGAVSGCAMAPVIPPRGLIYNDQTAPLFGGRSPGSAEGRASAYNVLLLFGWGNCSLKEALENGGIQEIRHVDYHYFNILGVYQRFTIIVRGEREASRPRLGPGGAR